ncbi:MAG: aspartyl protease family protein [Leeuwenhoekiella sp.]
MSVSNSGFGQGTFHFPKGINSIKIPVEISNNVVIMPVSVNGTELSFLLDTGVKSNVLFSIESEKNVKLNDTVKIMLTGAGSGDPIQALKSRHNIINVGGASAIDQNIYFITDGTYNFSPRLGQAVNGIIGYSLFKDFIVEINYKKQVVTLYKPETFKYKKCRSCFSSSLIFHANKPYINLNISLRDEKMIPINLLIDSGSGDALWLFENSHDKISSGVDYFEDYLGLGLTGDVLGKRSKIKGLTIGKMILNDVTVAYPYQESLKNMNIHDKRNGSLGAEILRRFTVIFDYPNKKLTLKKNSMFDEPFRYNRSGLIVQHSDYELVKEVANTIGRSYGESDDRSSSAITVFKATNTIQFKLKPNYEIAAIRAGSPGHEAGLQKGDKILKVNGRDTGNLKLDDINKYFFKDDGAILKLKIERNGIVFDCKFALRKIL